MLPSFYALLADAILALHFGFVAFVVLGLVMIYLGGALGWRWVRNRGFRLTHLAAMGIVVVEALAGIVCPLTDWEIALRRAAGQPAYEESFMETWVGRLMFFDFEPWVFTLAYVLFFIAIVASFWLVPPDWRRHRNDVATRTP